ncbi:hypothetical protein DEU56DRAFT_919358 [Suillus clintonianus]|uniref:uncharacterized protein n=1 Tax=Suillus clintonianus TaxID=1904413 RepID=UPI001B883A6D|nr:uncharacterized protein DEU56DRAFT_919358 [Suillus clintonianus]KAG2115504.1 hypothetical protein DEU56DRAFT_919358 [Suillus clintonianus]
MTRAARVVMQGYLTASFFKEIVIDHTIQVVSESEEVSVSLVTFTVCFSTAVLLQASAKAARQFLSDDFQRVPAPKDHTAGLDAPFAGGNILDATSTTKAFGTPARPSSSRAVIESTEPTFEAPTKGLSTTDSDTTLIADDEELAKDVFCCDRVSDVESLADESTFYEDATAHCLADDKPDHTLHVGYDPQTIDNLVRIFSAISLDDVPARLSAISLDNVSPHLLSASLDNVSSHSSTLSLDVVSSDLSISSLDNVPFHLSSLSPDDVSYHSSIPSLDNVPSHLSSLSPDDVSYHLSTPYLDNVPSHVSTPSLDNVTSHLSSISPDNVSSHLPTPSLDNVPSQFSLDDVPSRLSTIGRHHALQDHAIDILPYSSQPPKLRPTIPVFLPLDGSPQSSICQPQRALVHDYSIDNLIRKIAALSLDEVPSQLSILRPHHALHNHAIDALPNDTKALTLDDDHAINNTEALTLDDHHTFDSLLQKSEALTLDDNHAIDTLPDNTEALTLDDNHAINALLQNPDALTTLYDDAIDDLLQKMEALTLDDNPHYTLIPRHLLRNGSYATIAVLDPRNFNYDSPYTTMLSTPYFDMWNLIFSTIPLNSIRRLRMSPLRPNASDIVASNTSSVSIRGPLRPIRRRLLMASLTVPYDMELLSMRSKAPPLHTQPIASLR